MSTTAVPRPRPATGPHGAGRPLWVSVEGINGVGKSTAVRAVAAALGPRCLRLEELTDQSADSLPGQVITALAAGGDVCLRTGHPVTETLALLALKFRESERLTTARPKGVQIVLEDRGVDSVAVCQAAILHAEHPATPAPAIAERILATARRWRPMPDATVLLVGDSDVCAARFAERIGRAVPPDARAVIKHTGRLYRRLAAAEPDRYTLIDVSGCSPQEAAKALEEAVRAAEAHREAAHAA
ncbi:thymidylate kinase [Kitasatospora sp. NPDC056783]|uniref:thymidylate kinase n=1 Tax=Kitasatospora sp. NPDC056783 TaxID=3345943 RepID=UPI0036CE3CC7